MVSKNCFAADNAGSISRAREVENLVSRAFRITRDAGGARFEHAEIAHAPFGCIAADQHDAIALLDALACEKSGDPRGELAQVSIRVLFLAPVTFDAHRDSRFVTLGGSLKQLE